jgi:hypothetical protein
VLVLMALRRQQAVTAWHCLQLACSAQSSWATSGLPTAPAYTAVLEHGLLQPATVPKWLSSAPARGWHGTTSRSPCRAWHSSSHVHKDYEPSATSNKEDSYEVHVDRQAGSSLWSAPNLLSLSRVAMGPVICYQILEAQWAPALSLLAVAGVSYHAAERSVRLAWLPRHWQAWQAAQW